VKGNGECTAPSSQPAPGWDGKQVTVCWLGAMPMG
jgi:hypothetical protein